MHSFIYIFLRVETNEIFAAALMFGGVAGRLCTIEEHMGFGPAEFARDCHELKELPSMETLLPYRLQFGFLHT